MYARIIYGNAKKKPIISKTLNNSDGWELRTMNYNSTQTRVQFRYKGDNAATSGVWFDNGDRYHIMATGE